VYARSADVYDLIYAGSGVKDYAAEAGQLDGIIRERNPAARSLLDVACGTGQHLRFLRERYQVEGVDLSPDMIEVARSNLPGVPLQVADMRTLHLGRSFDAVTCLFSAIGYMTEPGELREAVRRFAEHLRPGGVLVFDGWLRPDAWIDGHRPEPEVASDADTTAVRLVVGSRHERITEFDMHHMVRTDAGVEYFVEHHRLALTPTEEYVAAVEEAELEAEVLPDYLPGRDRIVGLRR
jgi:SAM-dependent methyltransferase